MSDQINEINNTIYFAKKHSLNLVPMYSTRPDTGMCFCGNIQCGAVGKHPMKKGWQTGPFLEKLEDFVTSYQGNNYKCNSAIATTASHAVIDCDSESSYQDLIVTYPELKNSPTVKTGKGYHIHLTCTFKLSNKIRILKDIDIKVSGGIATSGGSIHHSGHIYKWINLDNNLVPFPIALYEQICRENKKVTVTNELRTAFPEGERNSSLFNLSCDTLKKGLPPTIARELIFSVNQSSCNPPLPDNEVDSLFNSAYETISKSTAEPTFDISKLHGPLATLVQKVDPYTEANPIAVYMQMLAIMGNYFGRIAGSHVSGDKHYPNIFLLIVGNSSVSRKGTSLGVATAILKQVIPNHITSNLKSGASSGEGIAFHLRDPVWENKTKKREGRLITEKVLVDQGVPDKRVVVIETEFGSVLISMKREGNKLSVVLRDAYDSKNLSTLTKNNSVTASNPHITIIAHITIEEFRHLLNVVDIFNGFGNRFMYFYTKSEKCLPHAPAISDIDLIEEVKALQKAVDHWSEALKSPHEIRFNFNEEAAKHWEQVYPEIKDPKIDGIIGTCLSRGPAHIKKLCITLAMLDSKNEIQLIHLETAIALWNYSSETVKYIFKDKAQNVSKPALKALKYLEESKKPSVSRTEISSDCFKRNLSANELDKIQCELVEKDIIKINEEVGAQTWELTT